LKEGFQCQRSIQCSAIVCDRAPSPLHQVGSFFLRERPPATELKPLRLSARSAFSFCDIRRLVDSTWPTPGTRHELNLGSSRFEQQCQKTPGKNAALSFGKFQNKIRPSDVRSAHTEVAKSGSPPS